MGHVDNNARSEDREDCGGTRDGPPFQEEDGKLEIPIVARRGIPNKLKKFWTNTRLIDAHHFKRIDTIGNIYEGAETSAKQSRSSIF